MKIIFSGKYFFIRYIVGSMSHTGRPVADSLSISLSGKYTFMELVNIISTTWSYKVVVSIVLLLAIALVEWVKKIETPIIMIGAPHTIHLSNINRVSHESNSD